MRSLPFQVVGKTGTSNDGRDAWFVGGTPRVAFGVWVGYDHPVSLGKKEAGGRTAAPIARLFLDQLKLDHGRWPEMPEGVVKRIVDEETGLLAREIQAGVKSYYLRGTEPTEFAPEPESDEGEGLFLGEGEE